MDREEMLKKCRELLASLDSDAGLEPLIVDLLGRAPDREHFVAALQLASEDLAHISEAVDV